MRNLKVRKKEKIRNRYNQEARLTQYTICESDKNTHNRAKRSELSQQLTTRLQETDTKVRQKRNTNNKNNPQKEHRLKTVSKKITGWLKHA